MDASDIAKKYRKSDKQNPSKESPTRRGYGSSEADLLVKNVRLENEIKEATHKSNRYKALLEAAQDDANELSAEVRTLKQQKATLQKSISEACKLLDCTKLSEGVQQTTKQLTKTKTLLVSILSHDVDEREDNDDNRRKPIDQLAKEVAITYRDMKESYRSITSEGGAISKQIEQQNVDIVRLTAELREEKVASAEAMKIRGSLAKKYDTVFASNKRLLDNVLSSLIRHHSERLVRIYYCKLLSALKSD